MKGNCGHGGNRRGVDNIWGSAEVRDLPSPLYKGSSQEDQMAKKQHVNDFRI